jgi:hypothetical protein
MNWSADQFAFTKEVDGEVLGWTDTTLWKAVEHLPPQTISVTRFPLKFDIWSKPGDQEELAGHLERILKADLDFPIILDSHGEILDGYHRLAKAMLMNHLRVRVVWLNPMPPPDFRRAK